MIFYVKMHVDFWHLPRTLSSAEKETERRKNGFMLVCRKAHDDAIAELNLDEVPGRVDLLLK